MGVKKRLPRVEEGVVIFSDCARLPILHIGG